MRAKTLAATRVTFQALSARNYRLFFLGQAVSVCGTWMQAIALTWLVLKLGGSGLVLGITSAVQYLPLLLFGPLAGVLVDRFDKRRLLFVTQGAAGIVAVLIGVLTATDTIRLWMVFPAAVAMGIVNALDVPTRQSFTYEMVGPELLPNAITLNSVLMNGGRVIGPAIAGITIATIGVGPCFLLNGFSFASLIIALLMMDLDGLHRAKPVPRRKGQLREGLAYVRRTPSVRGPLLLMALIGTFTYEFQVMLPSLAVFTFGSGAAGLSLFMSAMGAGSVVGGLIAAGTVQPSGRRVALAGLSLGVLVMIVGLMPTLITATGVLVLVGAASITFLTLANSTLQLSASAEMRGRVMALYSVAFLGTIPIGGPIMGFIAEQLGARAALLIGGGIAVAAVALAWPTLRFSREIIRPDSNRVEPGPTPHSHPQPDNDRYAVDERARGARLRPALLAKRAS